MLSYFITKLTKYNDFISLYRYISFISFPVVRLRVNPASRREEDATIIFRSTGSLNDYASEYSLGYDYNNNASCCCSIGLRLIFILSRKSRLYCTKQTTPFICKLFTQKQQTD